MHLDTNHIPLSQILVNANVEEELEQVQTALATFSTVIIYHEDFLIEHAKEVTKAAYIAEATTKFIVIAGLSFNQYVQNALLKLFEEPPRNIRFILITPSKSILLPTILSRLPISRHAEHRYEEVTLEFSFKNFDLATMYAFLKKHERIGKRDAKAMVEAMFLQASRELGRLTHEQLHAFERALPLLELNSRPSTLFTAILLNFLPQKG